MSEEPVGVPAFIDEHDGFLDSVCLFPEGEVEVRFGSLNAFWSTETQGDETEAYEVRSHRAVLRMSGLSSIVGEGVWKPKLSVGDGDLYGMDGERLEWRALLLAVRPIQRLEFLFTTGDRLKLHAREAHLSLEGKGDFLERWSGSASG